MPELFPVPLAEQIAEVEREIAMRESVYPRWVELKRISQAKADRQFAAMSAALETLRGMQSTEAAR